MKRQRIEIMAHILTFCRNPSRKTRIMYQNNMSHTQANDYLMLLTSRDLLAHNSETYATTEKGLRFLRAFAQLKDALEDRSNKIFVEINENYTKRALLEAFPTSKDTRQAK